MKSLRNLDTKELLSDYRHITCYLREMYEQGNAITGTSLAAHEFVELCTMARTQDERSNLKRALTHYLKF